MMDVLLLALRLLLALLLYTFLAAVLWALWRDFRRAATGREVAQPIGQLAVFHTEGDHIAEGETFPLRFVNSIGRSPVNTIHIPDTYASAQHALLVWREGQWWLEDQGSRNGTLLNGIRIDEPTVVSAGDVIGVGRTQLKLTLE